MDYEPVVKYKSNDVKVVLLSDSIDGRNQQNNVLSEPIDRIKLYGECKSFSGEKGKEDNDKDDDCNRCLSCHRPFELHQQDDSNASSRQMVQTDAWGEIKFSSNGARAKYIAVADNTDPDLVFEHMKRHWQFKDVPKLLLSITGGGKRGFACKEKVKDDLKKSIRKIVKATDVWIVTGGTDEGVMKFIGEILENERDEKKTLIGVNCWGIITGRESLQQSYSRPKTDYTSDEYLTYPPEENMESGRDEIRKYLLEEKERGVYLDKNHTNFVLVDTGKVGLFGGEIDFRNKLEKYIMMKQIDSALNNMKQYKTIRKNTQPADHRSSNNVNKYQSIGGNAKLMDHQFGPAILLVIEGGRSTIKQVKASLEYETSKLVIPVVIVKGTGRAADVLSYAYPLKLLALTYPYSTSESNTTILSGISDDLRLRHKIEKTFPDLNPAEQISIFNEVILIMNKKSCITIYSPEENTSLDETILLALMKVANSESSKGYSQESLYVSRIAQLNLAMSWNRLDLAKKEIFKNSWKHDSILEDFMMEALISNKHEFVELLLDNGFEMNHFLSYSKLGEIYYQTYKPDDSFLRAIIDIHETKYVQDWDSTSKTERQITRLQFMQLTGHLQLSYIQKKLLKMLGIDVVSHYRIYNPKQKFKHPFSELFIWAVLSNKYQMALCFWRYGEECIAKTLVGRWLYQKISLYYQHHYHGTEEQLIDKFEENALRFGELAVGLLDECASRDRKFALKLLKHKFERWGNEDLMSLAANSNLEEFIAHSCCQDLLSLKWKGGITFTGTIEHTQVLFGLFCFPLIYRKLRFQKTKRIARRRSERLYSYDPQSEEEKKSFFQEAKLFYTAPVTRFWSYSLAFIVFLGLFSYVVTSKLEKSPSIIEHIVTAFVVSLAFEEIRQICQIMHCPKFRQKLKKWWAFHWNKFDFFAIFVYFIGFTLRMVDTPNCVLAAHVVYALDNMLWMYRLLGVFSFHTVLGPYIVMVERMMSELIYFFMIFIVFLLSYGVTKFAILQPHEGFNLEVIKEIIGVPYFQMYGELLIEHPPKPNETMFSTKKHNSYSEPIATFLMSIYLLFTNILLVNLLIAVFNNTYQEVKINSKRIWRYQRFYLVEEFANHPSLPPPFIIIEHVKIFIEWLMCSSVEGKKKQGSNEFESRELYFLMNVERENLTSYLEKEERILNDSHSQRIQSMEKRLDQLKQLFQESKEENLSLKDKLSSTTRNSDIRLQRIEKAVTGQRNFTYNPLSPFKELILQRDTNPMLTRRIKKQVKALVNDKETRDETDTAGPVSKVQLANTKAFKSAGDVHILSRCITYPHSTVKRFMIPDFKVSWKEPFPEYNPHPYTAPSVMTAMPWNDEVLKQDNLPLFNQIDKENSCDRRSFEGEYEVEADTGLPRNPAGRTGITGRGLLGRYGPNHIAEAIFTRWKSIQPDNEKRHLEVLLIEKDVGAYVIPADRVEPNKRLPVLLSTLFSETTLQTLGMKHKRIWPKTVAFESLIKNGIKVFEGYLDDERNTDNAWLETSVYNFPMENNGEIISKFLLYDEQEKILNLKWIDLHENTPLIDKRIGYLEFVAKRHDAFFSDLDE